MPSASVQLALETARDILLSGRTAEALTYCEAALAEHPDSLDLQLALANMLTDSGSAPRALPIYERVMAAGSAPSATLQRNYGIALYKSGRPSQGVHWLSRALSEAPDDTTARSVLLMAMVDAGMVAEARFQGRALLEQKDARALSTADPVAVELVRSSLTAIDWQGVLAKPRVIAISLWGNQPKYLDGILITCALAARFYPGWIVRIYLDDTVPAATVSKLRERGAEVIEMPVPKVRQAARLWRFMVADDQAVGFFICRDCDSPIYPKEANAVAQWIQSGKPFHVMRDHPYQAELVLAGMWGGVAGLLPPLTPKINALAKAAHNPLNVWIDQEFLAEHVWPYIRDAAFVQDRTFEFGGPAITEIDVTQGVRSTAPLEWGYCRHGVMVWPRFDQFIGASLREYGEWSEEEITLLTAYISRGDVIVEGGANVGAHTLALARAVGSEGRVLAFEPQSEVCRVLKYNAGINGLDNVVARCCALGIVSGCTSVIRPDYSVAQNFGAFTTGQGSETVEMTCIDDLCLDRLDLLKLDVQGHELKVLQGAARAIAQFRPVLYLESDQRELAQTLIAFVRQIGYQLWWHTPFLYSPNNWKRQAKDVFPKILSVNMLCLPPERSAAPQHHHLELIRDQPWPSWVS